MEHWRQKKYFLNLNSIMGLDQPIFKTPKTPTKKLTLTVFELQQLPDIEKTDPNRATYCLNWTIKIGRRKICANINTDTGNLNNFGTVTKTVCSQMIVKLILY